MVPPSVAVVDIGSNSIKLLVARRYNDGEIIPAKFATIDARLGGGITAASPRLTAPAQDAALAAIESLISTARNFAPTEIIVVATSAVREAVNGPDFAAAVQAACGVPVRILSGEEEAALIGRGLLCDPAISGERDFEVFDLGGGSMECLAFADRKLISAASVPLGCVRLTETFVPDPTAPLASDEEKKIGAHSREVLAASGFKFGENPQRLVVGTGGTITTLRAINAAEKKIPFDDSEPLISLDQIAGRLRVIGSKPLSARQKIPGLPPARADVFPTALATLVALAEIGRFQALRSSVYNLRFGVAAEVFARIG